MLDQRLPDWVPDTVRDVFRDATFEVDGVNPWTLDVEGTEGLHQTARTLVTSPAMKRYWRSAAGKKRSAAGEVLARRPREFWLLADCVETACTEGCWRGAFSDRFAPNVRWMLRKRAEREQEAQRIAERARELQKLVRDTEFDRPAFLLLALGDVAHTPEESRADGPAVTRVLDGLATYAGREAYRSPDLPAFRKIELAPRLVMALAYVFHNERLGLTETASLHAVAGIATALFGREFTRGDARNAIRTLYPSRGTVKNCPSPGEK